MFCNSENMILTVFFLQLVHKNVHKPPAPVLIIDADQTEEELCVFYEKNRNKILGLGL